MADGNRTPADELRPEERLAAVLVDRFDLEPPIDLSTLSEAFADIEHDAIPGNCDGLVVGLHGPRQRPLIILKTDRPSQRQRFTLAHELGHVVLPWHLGTSFVCSTTRWFDEEGYHRASAETEANRFAAHLLLPAKWLDDLLCWMGVNSVGPLLDEIAQADVSAHVACLRLARMLPRGRVFALLDYTGKVVLSGRTRGGSGLPVPSQGQRLERNLLDRFAVRVEEISYGPRTVVWWTFQGEPGDDDRAADQRSVREVLDALLERHFEAGERQAMRQSLGGVIGAENGLAKRESDQAADRLYVRFRARFAVPREYPIALLKDPDFDLWVRKRADELGRTRPS